MPFRAKGPQTRKHLKVLLRQEVPGDLEVIVAVEERSDPVARLASRLQERYDLLRVTYSEERGAQGQVQQGLSSMGYGEKLVDNWRRAPAAPMRRPWKIPLPRVLPTKGPLRRKRERKMDRVETTCPTKPVRRGPRS